VPATSRFPPRQPEPKELETLFLEVHDPCLLFVVVSNPPQPESLPLGLIKGRL
jgi:hypothetical protein